MQIDWKNHNSRQKNIACLIERKEKRKGGMRFTDKPAGQRAALLYRGRSSFFSFSISRSFGKLIRLNNSLPYSKHLICRGHSSEL